MANMLMLAPDALCHFVAEIQAGQSLVNSIRELITRFERKIQSAIARVWGEATP